MWPISVMNGQLRNKTPGTGWDITFYFELSKRNCTKLTICSGHMGQTRTVSRYLPLRYLHMHPYYFE